jgi:PhnB protein
VLSREFAVPNLPRLQWLLVFKDWGHARCYTPRRIMNKPPFVQPYLFFNGRCQEALEFYRKALGIEVTMTMLYRESPEPPLPGAVPDGWEDKVMHAAFKLGKSLIMASDGCSTVPVFQGFALSLSLPDEAGANRAFAALSEGGKVLMPLRKTFWSPCFGMVTDRFGVGWMITVAA